MLLEDAERQSGLGRGTRLGDNHQRVVLLVEHVEQVVEIILAHTVASVEDGRFLLGQHRAEAVLQSLDDGTRAQVGAADADDHHHVGALCQVGGALFHRTQLFLRNLNREVHPS